MKKILLSFLTIGLFLTSFGQNDYKKRPALAIHFILNDFNTAASIRSTSLSNVLQTKQWKRTGNMAAGLGFSYLQGLSNHIDFETGISASFLNYPVPGKVLSGNNDPLLEAVASANVKLLSDKYWISPYISGGLGASKYKGYYSAIAPVGLGLQVNLFDEAFLLINTQYRIPITENAAYHFYHSVGIAGNIGKKKEVVVPVVLPPVVEAPKDRDGDGVIDAEDKCPDVKGLASLQGCPDRDGDGIADAEDKCPDVAGLAKYQGCPIPDTDGDGINDEQDKCPTVKGVARYQGCPVPDKDNDGVNDEEDKCPNEAGPATNYGCPVIAQTVIDKINYAAKNIFFATGSAKLLPKSFKSLNEVVKILNDDKTLKLDIDGHTDSQGKPDKNQTLSENRAAAVKAYLVSKGVDESKLFAAGHGQDVPVADNKTAAGRAKNRRVEMKARNY
ncbi:OmpA family protein [Ferruginibacter sp. SUN106]|uniref:OmpA family protein n=1 Tax=Ferruginibacter sp. SUN106 TaxID=2978348 RepID=UPI003D35A8A1